jgi:quercetin dioxygenase-like cupin family protein
MPPSQSLVGSPMGGTPLTGNASTSRSTTLVPSVEFMQLIDNEPTVQGPAELFTGDVYFNAIAHGEDESRIRVNIVRFTPCARTAWHSHSLGQTLYVTEGIGIVATRDTVIIMRAGDTVHTPPGEMHWHGAVADRFMTHLAMWEDDDATWSDHVTDEEYGAANSAAQR